MAKKQKPTNAFGISPDSFEAAELMEEQESHVTPGAPAAEIKTSATPSSAADERSVILIPTETREIKNKHVHFLAKSSLIDELDACAEELGMNRTAAIEIAITHFLASTKKKV